MCRFAVALAVVGLCVLPAAAGPDWEEATDGGGDAGLDASGAQPVLGSGAVSTLRGRLAGTSAKDAGKGAVPADFEDVYRVRIAEFSSFSATVDVQFGGAADFPALLTLYRGDGQPLLANKAGFMGLDNSFIQFPATDGSPPPMALQPGEYLIGISGRAWEPLDVVGLPLFVFDFGGEISGPDGPLGPSAMLGAWNGTPQEGDYKIVLTGVLFLPAPCNGADLAPPFGALNFADVQAFLAAFGAGDPEADLAPPAGVFNFADVQAFLAEFGQGC